VSLITKEEYMSKIWAGIKKGAEWLWLGFVGLCVLSIVLGIGLAFFAMICDTIFNWGSFLVKPAAWMIFPPGIALAACMCLFEWIGSWGDPKPTYGGGGYGYIGCGGSSDDSSSDDYRPDDSGPTPGYGGSI
jgi:hypothetical protein